jgi:type I restriction enzyme R subunit
MRTTSVGFASAGCTISFPAKNVITDCNDVDDQLHGVFSRCSDLLRQTPAQSGDRAQLRELLDVPAGGVVFTTIQKFLPDENGDRFPLLSDRGNIVVIADEACSCSTARSPTPTMAAATP